ncbi:hypothetical protein SCAR479_04098 [Seiridium cardinale]|uniref:Uncharacterized protein n=1 Tax=Seiridium cardinale TaxID=138064 RepID=A0ABR2XYJ5_9PEZI
MSAAPVQTGYDEDFHQVGQQASQASMTELMRKAGATGLRRRAVSLGVDHWKTLEWCRSEPWLPSGFGEVRQFPDWTKSWADSAAGVAVRIRVLPAMSASAVRPSRAQPDLPQSLPAFRGFPGASTQAILPKQMMGLTFTGGRKVSTSQNRGAH